jgi:hypothetical protein
LFLSLGNYYTAPNTIFLSCCTVYGAGLDDFFALVYSTVFDAPGVTLTHDSDPERAIPWVLSVQTDRAPLASDLGAALALVPAGERVEWLTYVEADVPALFGPDADEGHALVPVD